jgi:hypothetical protein
VTRDPQRAFQPAGVFLNASAREAAVPSPGRSQREADPAGPAVTAHAVITPTPLTPTSWSPHWRKLA